MHGHRGGDFNIAVGVFWFMYGCFSVTVAMIAMRIAQRRREERERRKK